MKRQSNQKRPENAGKYIRESLESQNFPGGHAPGPPRNEGPLRLRKRYPSVNLNYRLVQQFIETPAFNAGVLTLMHRKQLLGEMTGYHYFNPLLKDVRANIFQH